VPVPLLKRHVRRERQFKWPHQRRASVCGSAAALRSGCDSLNAALRSPLHFPRSPTADRSLAKPDKIGYAHLVQFDREKLRQTAAELATEGVFIGNCS